MRFRGSFLLVMMILFGCLLMFNQQVCACGGSLPSRDDPVRMEALAAQAPVVIDAVYRQKFQSHQRNVNVIPGSAGIQDGKWFPSEQMKMDSRSSLE